MESKKSCYNCEHFRSDTTGTYNWTNKTANFDCVETPSGNLPSFPFDNGCKRHKTKGFKGGKGKYNG